MEKKIYHQYQHLAEKYDILRQYVEITQFLKGTLTNYENFEAILLEYAADGDKSSPPEIELINEFIKHRLYAKQRIFCIFLSKRGIFLHVKNLSTENVQTGHAPSLPIETVEEVIQNSKFKIQNKKLTPKEVLQHEKYIYAGKHTLTCTEIKKEPIYLRHGNKLCLDIDLFGEGQYNYYFTFEYENGMQLMLTEKEVYKYIKRI